MQNEDLWSRIAAHPMPADTAGRSFEQQLRDDQRISGATARRGIEEYKRFLYLCATGDGRSVPTKAVHAVWHLHLTHTRDYWNRFVPNVLDGVAIHHAPGEVPGHRKDFAATLRRYEEEFGEAPPKGIWKRNSALETILGTVFASASSILWVSLAYFGGAPLPFVLFGGLIGGTMIILATASTLTYFGFDVGYEIDIWSDSEGGDCGDCGGGCGD